MLKVLVLSLMIVSRSAFSQQLDESNINFDVFTWLGSNTGALVAWVYSNERCEDSTDYWNFGHKVDNVITVNKIDPDFDNLQTFCSDYKNVSTPGAVSSCVEQTCKIMTSFHPSSLGDKYLQFNNDVIATISANAPNAGARIFMGTWKISVHGYSAIPEIPVTLPPAPIKPTTLPKKKRIRKPNKCQGSIIEVDNQALGESIPVTGTPYSLYYYSDRVPGRLDNYKLTFPLISGQVPNSITSIDLDIKYAGRIFHQTFTPSANLSYDFFWDGKDSAGNFVLGSINAEVTITNNGPGGSVSANGLVPIGSWNVKPLGLNGWVVNTLNFYDKNTRTLYLGEGSFIADTGSVYQGGFSAPSKDGSELYIFDQNGKHIKTLNGLTGDLKLKFNYNENGGLVSIVDQYGNKTIFQHQDLHAIKIISPYGQETNLKVDVNNWLSEVTNPNQETYKMTYKSKGLLGSFQKPGGQISYMSYDPMGLLIKDEGAGGNFLSLFKTPTDNGWSIQTETAEGIKTKYDIWADDFNFTRKITDARDLETLSIDKPQGTSEERSPEGLVSQETTTVDPRFGSFAPYVNTSKLFVEGTNLNYVETTTKVVQFLTAGDNFHIKTQTIKTNLQNDPTKIYATVYDGVGRQFIVTSPQGRRSIASLNSNSEIASIQNGNLKPIQNNYDERGRVKSVVQGDRQVSFSYDNAGNLNRSIDIMGRTTSYLYDSSGRVIEKILPSLASIKFSYDKNGNVTSITPPQKNAHKFALNSFESVSQYTPPSLGGKITATTYSYNLDKQLTRIDRPDGKSISFDFDQNTGILNTINTPNGDYVHTYNEDSGLLSKIVSPDGVTTSFNYSGPLLRNEETIFEKINSNFILDYNSDFSLKSTDIVNDNIHSEVVLEYDKDRLPIKIGNESLAYDTNGLLANINLAKVNQSLQRNDYGELIEDRVYSEKVHKKTSESIYTLGLKRDLFGKIIQKIESKGSHGSIVYEYRYDSNDRLIEVMADGHSIRKYNYDENGNRIKLIEKGKVVQAIYDEQDRLLRYGKKQFKYNLNGDLESKIAHEGRDQKFEYDVFGNLKKVTIGHKDIIEYIIDGKNRRVGKKINGKLIQAFVYQTQTQIAAELDGNGKILKRFVYGSKPNIPDYFVANGKEFRIVSDQVGTPKLVIDVSTGKVLQEFKFDEFGKLGDNDDYKSKHEFNIILPFGFAGGLYDVDTGLLRFGARDYDADVGRWASKDPIRFNAGDTNLYGYTFNDPVNFIDPSGLAPGDNFWSESAAGYDAINYINGASIYHNQEFAGTIYRNALGGFSYTDPRWGGAAGANPGPISANTTAIYHTHAGFDPRYDNENFSSVDTRFSTGRRIGSYLGTPFGSTQYQGRNGSTTYMSGPNSCGR